MTLQELAAKYISGEISRLKVTRQLKAVSVELDSLFPENIPLTGKFYLYINSLPSSIGFCVESNRARSLISLEKGFRQFCGNASECECNLQAINTRWKTKTQDEHDQMTKKRRKTVQEKYGVDSVSQLDEIKEKAATTCIARYGAKSPTQNPDILRKSSATCLKNNGVNWPQQDKRILEKTTATFIERYGITRPAQHSVFQDKAKQTCVSRFGRDNVMQHPEMAKKVTAASRKSQFSDWVKTRHTLTPLFTVEEYANGKSDDLFLWKCNICEHEFYEMFRLTTDKSCVSCNPVNMSWGEIVIRDWLDELNVMYSTGRFDIISPMQLDFYLPDYKIAIEFNGIYWHSELAGRGKKYHIEKFNRCDTLGIKLIQIFEHELVNNADLIRDRIVNLLGKAKTKLYARNLEVIRITSATAREFFNKSHQQGAHSASVNYALVKDNVIYSAMSFSKARFSHAEWEIIRFASLPNYNVVGAASKLFTTFTRELSPASVVSYANLQWGKGEVYSHLGFEFSHYSNPNYWYFKGINSVTSRMKFQKHKLPTELHYLGSEWEIMKHLGWNRYWDVGNAVWMWKSK